MSNIVAIASVEAESAARAAGDVSLEDRARAAMRAVQGHWMATREEDQFAAACEGLARTASDEEMVRIEDDIRRLNILSALLSGVPVDMDQVETPENPLGLRGLWLEVTGSKRQT